MIYSFDTDIAKRFNADCAVIIHNIAFWQLKNQANGKSDNFKNGMYWVYNSVSAFGDLFPWLSIDQIRRNLEKLVEAKVLAVGSYNKKAYDRTKWYSITDEAICGIYQLHLANPTNGIGKSNKPIPFSKPIEKPISKLIVRKEENPLLIDCMAKAQEEKQIAETIREEEFNTWWSHYGKKKGRKSAFIKFKKLKQIEVDKCLEVVLDFVTSTPEVQFRPLPMTYLNGEYWEDEIYASKPSFQKPSHQERVENAFIAGSNLAQKYQDQLDAEDALFQQSQFKELTQ